MGLLKPRGVGAGVWSLASFAASERPVPPLGAEEEEGGLRLRKSVMRK
jgi:hypothetical protein